MSLRPKKKVLLKAATTAPNSEVSCIIEVDAVALDAMHPDERLEYLFHCVWEAGLIMWDSQEVTG